MAREGSDQRVVAAAAVGSSADGGDRWSDLDLTFAAAVLPDVSVLSSISRMFLLSGLVQVDLSFARVADFGVRAVLPAAFRYRPGASLAAAAGVGIAPL